MKMKKFPLIFLIIFFALASSHAETILKDYIFDDYSCIESQEKEYILIYTGLENETPKYVDGAEIYGDLALIHCDGKYILINYNYTYLIENCECAKPNYGIKRYFTDQGIFLEEYNNWTPKEVSVFLWYGGFEFKEKKNYENFSVFKYETEDFKLFVYGENLSDMNNTKKINKIYTVECMKDVTDEECISYLGLKTSKEIPTSNLIFILFFPAISIFSIIFLFSLIKRKERYIPTSLYIKTIFSLSLALILLFYFYSLMFLFNFILFIILLILPLIALIKGPRGLKLKKEDAPKLFELLEDISKKMKIKVPKNIILTPGTEIGVRGVFKKTLILGMAGILNLKTSELYAILAHEFGHLKGFDTIIGGVLMSIKIGLDRINRFLGIIGRFSAIVFLLNLVLYFYNVIYTITILWYSRCREFTADLRASSLVGTTAFSQALNNYVKYTTFFDIIVPKAMIYLAHKKKIFKNVYLFFKNKLKEIKKEEIESLKEKITSQKSSMFSTHPNIKERIELIKGFERKVKLPAGKAINLIKDNIQKEEELTKILNEIVFKIKLK